MPSTPFFVRAALAGVLAFALFLGLAAAHEKWTTPELDFEPVREASALDGWSWPEAEPGMDPTGEPHGEPGEDTAADSAREPTDEPPGADTCASVPSKWLMIGWDGADWQFILPMLEAGELPNLERLMRGGAHGTLHSIVPTLSPAIWTTVATGVTPGEHGILHFYNQKPRLERWLERAMHFGELRRELYSNADRQRRAIWNLLDERERRVMMVGYHNTFPVEEIDGLMVSNYLVQDSVAESMNMEAGDSSLASSLVYPNDHLTEVLDIQKRVNRRIPEIVHDFAQLPEEETTDFLRRSRYLDPDGDQRPYFLVHAWAFDAMIAETAAAFLPRIDASLSMVHFQSLDWAAHRFLYYHAPELFEDMDWDAETRAALEAERPKYAGTVSAFYRWMDDWLGRFDALRGPDTALLLLSDHGFAAENDVDITGGHDHAPPGIVVMNGPGIRPGTRIEGADIYDILPTLMAGLGLPVAEDLRGEPIRGAFCETAWQALAPSKIASYGTDEPFVPSLPRPENLDQELLEQLESLGYLN